MHAAPDPLPMLPETADALRTLLLAAWAERDSVAAERDALAEQNDRLRHLRHCCMELGCGRSCPSSGWGSGDPDGDRAS